MFLGLLYTDIPDWASQTIDTMSVRILQRIRAKQTGHICKRNCYGAHTVREAEKSQHLPA